MHKKIELLILLLALAGIYTVSRNLEKYVQSDQVKSEQEAPAASALPLYALLLNGNNKKHEDNSRKNYKRTT